MSNLNLYLRFTTITLFIILHIYWRIADKGFKRALIFENPLTSLFNKSILSYAQFLVVLQLVGLSLLPKPQFLESIQIIAILISLIGPIICITARQTLGENWTNAKDYRENRNLHLVTSGIYGHIRHPIYLGVNLILTGGEILANSYLIILLPLIYYWTYNQVKKEEDLLLTLFGKKFTVYKAKTKMFLPYLI